MGARFAAIARRAAPHLAVLAVLAVLALVLTWRLWVGGHPTTSVLCQCGDPGQTVWFLEWVPWALAHGHDPLFTNAIFAGQGGANLLQSTSYLLPALLLAPVTWLFGPTASFNAAELLAPVLSGWCMFLAARRVCAFFPGQLAASLLWAFSPLLVEAEMFGHLNFTILYFPPLAFCALHELFTGSRSPVVAGILLGLLVVAQFFTGTEPLAITAVAIAFGCLVACALAPRLTWGRRRRIGLGLASAAAVAGVLLAYPLDFFLAGPRHVVGEPWPLTAFYGEHALDIVSPARPGSGSSVLSRVGGYFGPGGPGVAFLGLPLLVSLAVSSVVWWRRRIAWVLVVTGAFSWLCSLGAVLLPLSSQSYQRWLPWRYLQSWPLLASIGPNRFTIVVDACAALLVAISVDAWIELARAARRWLAPRSRALAAGAAGAVSALLAAGLALSAEPLVTTSPFPLRTTAATVPAWFRTTALRLGATTVVLTYPYASSSAPDAMYWQAQEGLAFRLVGGRALVPGADGVHSLHVDPATGLDPVLQDASFGTGLPAPPSAATLSLIRRGLRRWGVQVVVVVRRARAPAWMAAVMTDALGEAPRSEQGSLAWFDVGSAPASLDVAAGVVERCAGDGAGAGSFARAPACVLAAARRH